MLTSQLYAMGLTDTPACVANPLNGGGLTYDSYYDPATGSAVQRSCDPSSPSKAATNAAGYAWAGTLINTVTPYLNMASATIDGIDFDITYKSPMTSIGRFQVVSDATWLLDYQRNVTAASPIEHDIGRGGAARWRANFNLLWYYKEWNAGIAAYYIGDYADTGASFTSVTLAQAAHVPASSIYAIDGVAYWKVASTVIENAFVSYTWESPRNRWLDGMSVRLGVNDLTDRKPPLTSGQEGYDASVYSSLAVGRVYSLQLDKRF
jgi:hypothetical protein